MTRNISGETHKIRWEFVVQTDDVISNRRPDLEIVREQVK